MSQTPPEEKGTAVPYPPMSLRNQKKSSLSSRPQFSSTTSVASSATGEGAGSVAAGTTSTRITTEGRSCVARFCHPAVLAVTYPLPSAPLSERRPEATRKKGPILLELQKLTWNPTPDSNITGLYKLETILQSRGNPALGTSVFSTCLDVPLSSSAAAFPTCATGLSSGALCLHQFDQRPGSHLDSPFTLTSTTEYFHTGRNHRPATAVAWRPDTTNTRQQIAIGWARGSGGSGTSGSGERRSSQPHDRDFGCFVWDVQASSTTTKVPLRRLAHQVGATDLGWIMNGDLLVLGTQGRTFQVFDMRAEQSVSHGAVHAHPSSVRIRPDPQRPYHFATFSGTAAEPVKLWDARRIDSPVSEIKWSVSAHANDVVSDVQWSRVVEGQLTIAVGDALYDYDTSSRPLQVGLVSVPKPIASFCLYPFNYQRESAEQESSSIHRIEDLYHHRAIVCYTDRTVQDVAKHRLAPLGISRRDGRIAKALGGNLWIGSTVEGPAAMECLQIRPEEDVSATMMRRARCLHVARYSMDTESNIKLLAEDGNVVSGSGEVSPTREALLRLWTWIDRMESLFVEDDGTLPTLSLVEAGASLVLRKIAGEENVHFSEILSCSIYSSPSRRAALTSCGWAGKFDLSNVLSECEALGEFERSAALAVWHGEVGAGVEALQRGASALRNSKNAYAETLELVALCVAGFRGGNDPSLGVWRQACSNLMNRSELSGVNRSMSRVAYLRGLLKFLMNTDGGHQQVLDDDDLSLCDRVGFACRFLAKDALHLFLDSRIEKCQVEGNIEGLTITGIDRKGIKILQAFVDRYADVQTAALVTSRVILPAEWEEEKWICVEWLDAYRSLLNTWQMWQSRAMFDVDRSELLRTLQAREAGQNTTTSKGSNPKLLTTSRRFLMAVPLQMDARCTYCQQSLSLKQNNNNTNQWLREMNKVSVDRLVSCACRHIYIYI